MQQVSNTTNTPQVQQEKNTNNKFSWWISQYHYIIMFTTIKDRLPSGFALHPAKDICHGTWLIVKYMLPVTICNGSHKGTIATLPRINLPSAENTLPFILLRRQLPVKFVLQWL